MELTGTDRSLHLRTREQIAERLESRVEALIAHTTERQAGYIQGLRDAIGIMDEIAKKMAEPNSRETKG